MRNRPFPGTSYSRQIKLHKSDLSQKTWRNPIKIPHFPLTFRGESAIIYLPHAEGSFFVCKNKNMRPANEGGTR